MQAESINGWLEKVVAQHGPKTAVTFVKNGREKTRLAYAQQYRTINRRANVFLDIGIKKGDRVILFNPKSVFAGVAHFALLAVGAMAVPLNPGFKKNEMADLIGDAAAGLIIVEPAKKNLVRATDPLLPLLEISAYQPYPEIDFFRLPDNIPATPWAKFSRRR